MKNYENLKTIGVSVNKGDLADIDTYCTMHNLTRSKFFVQAALEKVQVEHLANALIFISGYLDKVDENKVSEADRKQLQQIIEFYRGCNV